MATAPGRARQGRAGLHGGIGAPRGDPGPSGGSRSLGWIPAPRGDPGPSGSPGATQLLPPAPHFQPQCPGAVTSRVQSPQAVPGKHRMIPRDQSTGSSWWDPCSSRGTRSTSHRTAPQRFPISPEETTRPLRAACASARAPVKSVVPLVCPRVCPGPPSSHQRAAVCSPLTLLQPSASTMQMKDLFISHYKSPELPGPSALSACSFIYLFIFFNSLRVLNFTR